jgi:pimeloyl-ACP methyl ester carboxylesterase
MSNTLGDDFTLQLHDGRAIGIATFGNPEGIPIFHGHGSGSSRLEVNVLATAATAQGVRLIGLDRPGIGRSNAKPGYRLLDWPDDVLEVTNRLSIERFAVEGVSAGGPFALTCAYKIPQRLTACGLISTLAPPELISRAGSRAGSRSMRLLWQIAARAPWLVLLYARLVQRMTGADVASLERYLVRYAPRLGKADQQILNVPEIRGAIARAMAESFRQGPDGNLEIVVTEIRPWGFQVDQVTFEHVFLWHGEQDRIAAPPPVRLLAQTLPHCMATYYPSEGHFSTLANHAEEIFNTLSG